MENLLTIRRVKYLLNIKEKKPGKVKGIKRKRSWDKIFCKIMQGFTVWRHTDIYFFVLKQITCEFFHFAWCESWTLERCEDEGSFTWVEKYTLYPPHSSLFVNLSSYTIQYAVEYLSYISGEFVEE